MNPTLPIGFVDKLAAIGAVWLALAAPSAVAGEYTNFIGMKFVDIPAGGFYMGSCKAAPCPSGAKPDPDASEFEEAEHPVQVAAFQMGQTEVTLGQFKQFLLAASYTPDGNALLNDPDFVQDNKHGDNAAVTTVSWNDAQAFVAWLNAKKPANDNGNYRLPTAEEWEYAARAGSKTRYHFGDDARRLGEYAWYNPNDLYKIDKPVERYAHEVARKKPNTWGLYDVHGNVWEYLYECCKSRSGAFYMDHRGVRVVWGGGRARDERTNGEGIRIVRSFAPPPPTQTESAQPDKPAGQPTQAALDNPPLCLAEQDAKVLDTKGVFATSKHSYLLRNQSLRKALETSPYPLQTLYALAARGNSDAQWILSTVLADEMQAQQWRDKAMQSNTVWIKREFGSGAKNLCDLLKQGSVDLQIRQGLYLKDYDFFASVKHLGEVRPEFKEDCDTLPFSLVDLRSKGVADAAYLLSKQSPYDLAKLKLPADQWGYVNEACNKGSPEACLDLAGYYALHGGIYNNAPILYDDHPIPLDKVTDYIRKYDKSNRTRESKRYQSVGITEADVYTKDINYVFLEFAIEFDVFGHKQEARSYYEMLASQWTDGDVLDELNSKLSPAGIALLRLANAYDPFGMPLDNQTSAPEKTLEYAAKLFACDNERQKRGLCAANAAEKYAAIFFDKSKLTKSQFSSDADAHGRFEPATYRQESPLPTSPDTFIDNLPAATYWLEQSYHRYADYAKNPTNGHGAFSQPRYPEKLDTVRRCSSGWASREQDVKQAKSAEDKRRVLGYIAREQRILIDGEKSNDYDDCWKAHKYLLGNFQKSFGPSNKAKLRSEVLALAGLLQKMETLKEEVTSSASYQERKKSHEQEAGSEAQQDKESFQDMLKTAQPWLPVAQQLVAGGCEADPCGCYGKVENLQSMFGMLSSTYGRLKDAKGLDIAAYKAIQQRFPDLKKQASQRLIAPYLSIKKEQADAIPAPDEDTQAGKLIADTNALHEHYKSFNKLQMLRAGLDIIRPLNQQLEGVVKGIEKAASKNKGASK